MPATIAALGEVVKGAKNQTYPELQVIQMMMAFCYLHISCCLLQHHLFPNLEHGMKKDPKSGEGFTVIVNKVKEEKQNATAKLPSPMQQPHTSNTSALADQSKKAKVMLMLRDEFELTKALRGCRSLSEITRNHIVVDWNVPRDFPPAAAEITFEISAIKSFPVLRGNLFFLLKFLHYYDTIKAFV